MIVLEDLYPEIAADLRSVGAEVAAMAASDHPAVEQAARALATTPGKRLRPGLLLLAARACGGDGAGCIVPAAVIEVMHCVSLVHDDVIDGSDTRRGLPAAPARWGNKLAVLLGDHLLAAAFRRLAQLDDAALTTEIATGASEMCRGQIQELLARGPSLSEADYTDIISAKTASLFAVSTRIGAMLARADQAQLAALDAFGRDFGIAYQLADDILDLTAAPGQIGKSVGRDIAQGQVTLPVIYALREGTAAQRTELLALLDGPSAALRTSGGADPDLERVRLLIADAGGLEYAAQRVRHFGEAAAARLSALPPSPAIDCLRSVARDGLAAPIAARG